MRQFSEGHHNFGRPSKKLGAGQPRCHNLNILQVRVSQSTLERNLRVGFVLHSNLQKQPVVFVESSKQWLSKESLSNMRIQMRGI